MGKGGAAAGDGGLKQVNQSSAILRCWCSVSSASCHCEVVLPSLGTQYYYGRELHKGRLKQCVGARVTPLSPLPPFDSLCDHATVDIRLD